MKISIVFFLLTVAIYSQSKLSINPGIKLGVAFGDDVKIIVGTELSFVLYNLDSDKNNRVGITIDYEGIANVERFHIGLEYMYRAVGIDIGPTFVWKESKLYNGFSVIPFGGILLLPYINYTYINGMKDQYDIGTYFKLPIPLSKERLSFGG